MTKRIISVLMIVLMLVMGITAFAAGTNSEKAVNDAIYVKSADFNKAENKLTVLFANRSSNAVALLPVLTAEDGTFILTNSSVLDFSAMTNGSFLTEIEAGGEQEIAVDLTTSVSAPKIDCTIAYRIMSEDLDATLQGLTTQANASEVTYTDILKPEKISKMEAVKNFLLQTGFSMTNWQSVVMLLIACILLYLAIVKKFEPLLLLPIAFGMLLTNLCGAEMFHEELFAGGHVHWDMFKASNAVTPGLIDYLYLGVKLGIYPCLIFVGVGAMTDFGPLIANPKSLLLGAAAQVGIFATYIAATLIFTPAEAGSIGIIGGADGPTAIFVTTRLAPHLLGPIAVAAYSYMALVPVIQPPIMKLLTTKKERQIVMKELRPVSKT